MAGSYKLQGIRTFRGMDGNGLNATLLRDGSKVAFIIDEGHGGCMDFQWVDWKEKKEEVLFNAFIAELKATKSTEKDQHGFSERDLFDGDIWVWDQVEEELDARRMKRMCKTYSVFQVEGDKKAYPDGPQVLRLKKPMDQAREFVSKKYPGKKVVFLNEKYSTFPPMSSKPKPVIPVTPPVTTPSGAEVRLIPLDPNVTGDELENGVDCSNCKGRGTIIQNGKEEWCPVCKGAGRLPKRKPTDKICPRCKGSGQIMLMVRNIESGKTSESTSDIKCITCGGAGRVTAKVHEAHGKEKNLWCSCGNPSEDTRFCGDGECSSCDKHHYHCADCGKIVQVG